MISVPVAQLDTCLPAGREHQPMCFVYAIESQKDKRIYVGLTNDVERRIHEHNIGRMKSTGPYCPWKLFFVKQVDNRSEARVLEKKLKSGYGKEFLKSIRNTSL